MKNNIIHKDLLKKIVDRYNRNINIQMRLLEQDDMDDTLEGEIIMLEWLLDELKEMGLGTTVRKLIMEVNGNEYLS